MAGISFYVKTGAWRWNYCRGFEVSQLEKNVETVRQGPLPEKLVEVINDAWRVSKPDAPEYFTFYSPKK